jgi:hypothetical protein
LLRREIASVLFGHTFTTERKIIQRILPFPMEKEKTKKTTLNIQQLYLHFLKASLSSVCMPFCLFTRA